MRLDFDGIKRQLKYDDETGKIINSAKGKFKLLPFTPTQYAAVDKLVNVKGELYRLLNELNLEEKITTEELIESIYSQIEFEDEQDKERDVFREFIKQTFIKDDKLVVFNLEALNYVKCNKYEKKVAEFLFSILQEQDLMQLVKERRNQAVDNVLYKIILSSLPKLSESKTNVDKYYNHAPYFVETFQKDFEFMLRDEKFFIENIDKLLEHYYLCYIMHTAIKLEKLFNVDIDFNEEIYYTFSWEKNVSKSRLGVRNGWSMVYDKLENLYVHAMGLQLLNHIKGYNGDALNYLDILNKAKDISGEEKSEYLEDIDKLIEMFTVGNEMTKYEKSHSDKFDNDIENKIYDLYQAIKYVQFTHKDRDRVRKLYREWASDFASENFLKQRGVTGSVLSLDESRILFLTKLCINKQDKIRMTELFDELKTRGVNLDKSSAEELKNFFSKLNLIEKKSDSGDAQYVKSIL